MTFRVLRRGLVYLVGTLVFGKLVHSTKLSCHVILAGGLLGTSVFTSFIPAVTSFPVLCVCYGELWALVLCAVGYLTPYPPPPASPLVHI